MIDSGYSSDEKAIAEFLLWERRPYIVRPRIDYFITLGDTDFFMRFRLTKQTVLYVLNLIEGKIKTPMVNFNRLLSKTTDYLITL